MTAAANIVTTRSGDEDRAADVTVRLAELCRKVGATLPEQINTVTPTASPSETDRRGAPTGSDSSGVHALLDALSSAMERLVTEHRGMADELIAAYEQLGIVFEVTRSLPSFRHETQVMNLFSESLRRSFSERTVYVVRFGPGGVWKTPDSLPLSVDWLTVLLDRAVLNGASIVEPVPPSCASHGVDAAEILAAPVMSGDTAVFVVLLLRPSHAPAFRAADMMLVDSLTTFCGDLIRNLHLLNEVRSMSVSMVRALVSAVDQKDEYTCGHSLRVAYFADLLGRAIRLNDHELQMLQWSALLHDVGKIGIRDSVLKKAGKLTDEEFEHIKEHPVRSAKVVQDIPQLADALPGILHHHERYDGRGYPKGLAGEDIPLQARVIQIADIFDALTSDRSYRTAFTWEKALDILREESGTAVDPHLQEVFDTMMRDALSGDPEAWDRMLDQANAFTRTNYVYNAEGGCP